jgi:hypothetical protein
MDLMLSNGHTRLPRRRRAHLQILTSLTVVLGAATLGSAQVADGPTLPPGEVCEEAIFVPGVPFSDAGSTAGYFDNYDEICPYEGSTSPDVVYRYDPPEDQCINVSLCGNSDYDTKLYVYQGNCGNLADCNDDLCATPSFPDPFVSAIQELTVFAGVPYFFVVDGFGGEFGNYTIDITFCDASEQPEACCFPEGDCMDLLPSECVNSGGVPQGFGTDCISAPCEPQGIEACCFPGGNCFDLPIGECVDSGGMPQGPGTDCQSVSCDNQGLEACCFPDDSCQDLFPDECQDGGGFPQGPETDCLSAPCDGFEFEACCFADGVCEDFYPPDCVLLGGEPQGPGSNCDSVSCDVLVGSCCLPDGTCLDGFLAEQCVMQDGRFGGEGSLCDTTLCLPDIQACCLPDGICVELLLPDCVNQGGTPQGETTTCMDDVACPAPPEACCLPDGGCVEQDPAQCLLQDGVPGGLGTTCGDVICDEPTEACCYADGTCADVVPSACDGSPQGPGSLCAQGSCELPIEACCVPGGLCIETTIPDCVAQDGMPQGTGTTCVDAICTVAIEACCLPDGTCVEIDPSECAQQDGLPGGPATTCGDVVCLEPIEACCLTDGSCEVLPSADCQAQGGLPKGPGSQCEGDADGNGIDDGCESREPCEDCGPGDYWIGQEPCEAGVDYMPSGALVGIDLDLDCFPDLSFVLSGPTIVGHTGALDDSLHFPGTADIDGHLDVIDTDMYWLHLSGGGITLTAGAGQGVQALAPTLGTIVEQADNPAVADSFFNVFFEVDLGGGMYLYNQEALTVTSEVICLPPQASYLHPVDCIPLYTSPIPGEGVLVANLVSADHETFPLCGGDATGDCFTPHPTPFCNDATCCSSVCDVLPYCCESEWDSACVSQAVTQCLGCRGDFDGDGDVDLKDWQTMLECFGESSGGTCALGDFDENGVVDLEDFELYEEVLYGPDITIICPAPCNADLDIDSDNDQGPAGPARSFEEELLELVGAGKYICLNDDDDDNNKTRDLEEEPIKGNPPENDPVNLVLELAPNQPPGKWRLSYTGQVEVYDGPAIHPSGMVFPDPMMPNPKTMRVEGVTTSAALGDVSLTLDHDCDGDGIWDRSDTVKATVIRVDIDVDSDNTSNAPDFAPQRDAAEDDIEDHDDKPGKYVMANVDDNDHDGVIDYFDGYNRDGIAGNDDDLNAMEDDFVQVVLEAPAPIDLTVARFRVTYGVFRIWNLNGNVARDIALLEFGGNRIGDGSVYTAADLGLAGDRTTELWIEGLVTSGSLGSDRIRFEVDPDGPAGPAPFACDDKVRISVIEVDADLDSDNNNGVDPPDRSRDEDRREDRAGTRDFPGKLIVVNDDSDDYDGVEDRQDGYNRDGTANNEDDENDDEDDFVPLVLEVRAPIDLTKAHLRIMYDAEPPGAGGGGNHLRLWKKPGDEVRDPASANAANDPGDYVEPGTYMDLSRLGLMGATRTVTLYVEGINVSATPAEERLTFEIDPDGADPAGFVTMDAVRMTVFDINYILDNNDGNNGNDPALRVLNISNLRTNRNIAAGNGQNDPDNFKIEIISAAVDGAVIPAAQVELEARDNNGATFIPARNIQVQLNRVGATNRFRSAYLRLVVDAVDQAVRANQTLLITNELPIFPDRELLGQFARVTYSPTDDDLFRQVATVGDEFGVTATAADNPMAFTLTAHRMTDIPAGSNVSDASIQTRINSFVRQSYAQANVRINGRTSSGVAPVQNFASISHDHGRAASGLSGGGGASTITLNVTSTRGGGAVTWTITHNPAAAATPLATANALVAAIAATDPNPPGAAGDRLAATAWQNNAIFGVATRSADILITDPMGGTITITGAASTDTRQTIAAPAVTNAMIVANGTNLLQGSIHQRALIRNYDSGNGTIDLYVSQSLTYQGGGRMIRGRANVTGAARPALQQGINPIRHNVFAIASTADNTMNNPFTMPHECGHVLLDAGHVTGDRTQMMRSGTSGANAVGASKRILDGNRTFNSIGLGAGGMLNQVTVIRASGLVAND